jgi:hypothetical protein
MISLQALFGPSFSQTVKVDLLHQEYKSDYFN